MKRPVSLEKAFGVLRDLPVKVSFTQVETWVDQYEPSAAPRRSWLGLFLAKYFDRWSDS